MSLSKSREQQTNWSLILGITVWFVYLSLFYGVNSLACVWGWFAFTIAGIRGLPAVEALVTIVVLLLMLVLIYLPWRNWRSYQTEKPAHNPGLLRDTEKDRRPLAAAMAMLLNSLFCVFILATFVPIVALNACGQA